MTTDTSARLPAQGESTRQALLIALAMLILYLAVSSLTTLWDRDEPRFGRAAVEMLATGDFLVPTFNGDLRPDKPPLVYWLMTGFLHFLGTSVLAVRLPSVLGMVATALMVHRIGKIVAGPTVGLRAMVIFATMPLPFFIGTAATADGILLVGVTGAILCFVERVFRGHAWWQMPLLTLALSWALLAKGPVGLAIPLLTIVVTCILLGGDLRPDRRFWALLNGAVIVAVGIFLAWGLPANEATGGELARVGLGRHVFERAGEALEGHGGGGWLGYLGLLPFYLPVVFLASGAWSFLLIPCIAAVRGCDRRQRALISGWVIPTFVMMSLIATKLPHYILGIMPAIAIAIAITSERGGLLAPLRSLSVAAGVFTFALILIGLPAVLSVEIGLAVGLAGCALSFLVGLLSLPVIIGASQRRSIDGTGIGRIAAASALLVAGIGLLLMQSEGQLKVAERVSIAIEEAGLTAAPIVCHGFFEPSLVFRLDRQPVVGVATVGKLDGSLKSWAREEGGALLLTTAEMLTREGIQSLSELGLEPLAAEGWRILNYSTGDRVTVLLGYRP